MAHYSKIDTAGLQNLTQSGSPFDRIRKSTANWGPLEGASAVEIFWETTRFYF